MDGRRISFNNKKMKWINVGFFRILELYITLKLPRISFTSGVYAQAERSISWALLGASMGLDYPATQLLSEVEEKTQKTCLYPELAYYT